MSAYILLVIAVVSRLAPHPDWLNFTAVGGALLYFGARRSWREMLAPLVALVATDWILTVAVYHYSFQWAAYVTTWAWYGAVMVLGHLLLRSKTSLTRVAAGVILAPSAFFILSNYAVWVGGTMYPKSADGLIACYVAGLPFYRNDVLSTALVAGLAFGLPVLIRRWQSEHAVQPAA